MIYEDEIEQLAIDLLKEIGYEYYHGQEIAPDSQNPKRQSIEEVIHEEDLRNALTRLNPKTPSSLIEEAIKTIKHFSSQNLIENNEQFHKMLVEGVRVNYTKNGEERGEIVKIIDFQNPENNHFLVVNQYTVKEKNNIKRPDIVLFINGLPLVVIELKNPTQEDVNILSAYNQLQTYKETIPSLFTYNEILIISDGMEARAGSLTSGFDRFLAWKLVDGETISKTNQLETIIKGLLNKETIIDFIKNFVVFQKSKYEDKTGQISITSDKKIAAYHQYYAVNKAIKTTKEAISEKTKKAGVIWHTQGSGKSLTMVYYTGKIVQHLNNPTIVVLTDRNDLDDQLFETFSQSQQLLRQQPKKAENRDMLKQLLKVNSGGIVFTTIQKFLPEEGNTFETLSERENIIVIVDEAHRTQYGFKAKIDKDSGKTTYGYAKYIRDALPNATFIAFTGTPIEKEDKNTPAVFGDYIDIYDISQSIEDKMTVPIYYESRLIKVSLTEEGKKLIKEFEEELEEVGLESVEQSEKTKRLEQILGVEDRLNKLAEDIVQHFEKRQEVFEGKAMIAVLSRSIAARLYQKIIQLRPDWHSDDLTKGKIKVVYTTSPSDDPEVAKHHTTKDQRKILQKRMKDPQDELKLVIVVDMWLTGFDVPSLHTLYIDKPMKGHTLMQAIARVNRVYKDKPGGLIVDYQGIATDLKEALSFYSKSGGKGDPAIIQEEAVSLMIDKYEIVSDMLHGFDYKRYFTSDTNEKLNILRDAVDYVLELEDGKKRFIKHVTELSKAFALAIPHEKALEIKDHVAFFQAVKSRILKLSSTGENGNKTLKANYEIETTIKQILDKALTSDQVIDVFEIAGIKKPEISVLSEEFLLEIKNMKHKNIAIELLKRIINDQIKIITKRSYVKSKSLLQLYEETIKKYQNKILTAAQVIEELLNLAREIREINKEPEQMGLTEYEYAFYTAIADNQSALELMGKEKLKELAVVLFQEVRKNATIDWTIRENVKAKLKVAVKRVLRKYGYPPDMQELATQTVLKQAEMIAQELVEVDSG
jgi:type I site-specific deoxyribonuclease, HsdR family